MEIYLTPLDWQGNLIPEYKLPENWYLRPNLSTPAGKHWENRPRAGQRVQYLKDHLKYFNKGVWDTSAAKDEEWVDVGYILSPVMDNIAQYMKEDGKKDSYIWCFWEDLNAIHRTSGPHIEVREES